MLTESTIIYCLLIFYKILYYSCYYICAYMPIVVNVRETHRNADPGPHKLIARVLGNACKSEFRHTLVKITESGYHITAVT